MQLTKLKEASLPEPYDEISDLVNCPFTRLSWSDDYANLYNIYVSTIIPENFDLSPVLPDGVIEGATLTVTVYLTPNDSPSDGLKSVYFKITEIPIPPGFRSATLTVTILPLLAGGKSGIEDCVGNPEGAKSTSVDYADADENP